MGEYECELAQKEGKIETGILRLHNVYGPPCEMSPEKSISAKAPRFAHIDVELARPAKITIANNFLIDFLLVKALNKEFHQDLSKLCLLKTQFSNEVKFF